MKYFRNDDDDEYEVEEKFKLQQMYEEEEEEDCSYIATAPNALDYFTSLHTSEH